MIFIQEVKVHSDFLAEMFIVLAIGCGLGNFVQTLCFTIIGEKLTFRLRGISLLSVLLITFVTCARLQL